MMVALAELLFFTCEVVSEPLLEVYLVSGDRVSVLICNSSGAHFFRRLVSSWANFYLCSFPTYPSNVIQ